jgi:tetratricopeptide (TPR) repeat protein
VSTTVTPPIPKQPTGITFLVAVTVLGLFALFQLAAVAWYYIPILRADVVENRAEQASMRAEADPATAARTVAEDKAEAEQRALVDDVTRIVAEADRNLRVGDFDASLRYLQQAEALMPDEPSIQFRLGQVYESLNDKAQAFVAFERSIMNPGLPPDVRRQAEQKMALLAQVLGESDEGFASPAPGLAPPTLPPREGGGPVRDEIGLQPGSSLGIVSTRLRDSQPGAKTLSIAIKSRPDERIDAADMNVHVFFYEKDETGEVLVTEAKSTTQWISPPVDWSDGEPELLEVEYPLPDGGLPGSSADFGALGRKFHGYVVGVYYQGELQDSRADPGSLDQLFPLELYLQGRSN